MGVPLLLFIIRVIFIIIIIFLAFRRGCGFLSAVLQGDRSSLLSCVDRLPRGRADGSVEHAAVLSVRSRARGHARRWPRVRHTRSCRVFIHLDPTWVVDLRGGGGLVG